LYKPEKLHSYNALPGCRVLEIFSVITSLSLQKAQVTGLLL